MQAKTKYALSGTAAGLVNGLFGGGGGMVLVPLLLFIYCPEGAVAKQALTIVFKLLLMVPISALAYELIRYAARMPDGSMATLLRAPGLTLQRMTTAEPDERQLDVAVVALREALGAQAGDNIITAPYRRDA